MMNYASTSELESERANERIRLIFLISRFFRTGKLHPFLLSMCGLIGLMRIGRQFVLVTLLSICSGLYIRYDTIYRLSFWMINACYW